jgi:hypothetical protein
LCIFFYFPNQIFPLFTPDLGTQFLPSPKAVTSARDGVPENIWFEKRKKNKERKITNLLILTFVLVDYFILSPVEV